ncbi:hypothetical protein ACX12E_08430 [Paenibacillus vandeheii]
MEIHKTHDGLRVGPTIRERIESAISDEHPVHVIYCKRLEGTTTTIIDIASKDKGIKVAGHHVVKHRYTDKGVNWLSVHNSDIGMKLDGEQCHTIILDVIPAHHVKMVMRALAYRRIKLIVIKNVLIDESER